MTSLCLVLVVAIAVTWVSFSGPSTIATAQPARAPVRTARARPAPVRPATARPAAPGPAKARTFAGVATVGALFANCTPYPVGTSGAPLLISTAHGPAVAGVIGGLHQGGCYLFTSYSAPLGLPAQRAYLAAVARERGDTAPVAGSDGC